MAPLPAPPSMITKEYISAFAQYNAWQNGNILAAAGALTDEQRKMPLGAYFGSIMGTLSHLLWGDTTWLNRLTNTPYTIEPLSKSSTAFAEWDTYKETRINMDQRLLRWSLEIDELWLNGQLHYKTSTGADNALPTWLVITHLFNHQTHHRGQVHCMLTQLGITPPDTDILCTDQFQK
jgi:uncharacterized damage-inducible protein DinB